MPNRWPDWLKSRAARRREWTREPFPPEWAALLRSETPFSHRLDDALRDRLHDLIRIFDREKTYIGVDGLQVTQRMRLIVAAHACRVVLGRPDLGVFDRVREVILYPRRIDEEQDAIGPDGKRYRYAPTVIGQAGRREPVQLDWGAVEEMLRRPRDPLNVIVHEFAHVLDYMDGAANGTPPMRTRAESDAWASAFSREYENLRAALRLGRATFLDPYAATNTAEFFAVLCEAFFMRPAALKRHHADLHGLLLRYFGYHPEMGGSAESR
jgi:hypothetical protein